MRVALDIDDTITRCPPFFSLISKALIAAGHQVFVISYRMDQEAVEQELRHVYDLAFSEVILPTSQELDREGFYNWKANACRRLEIDIFFEDMPEVINELDPSVVAFMPYDAYFGKVTYVEQPEAEARPDV
jgi:hypothetical protein